ncbi:hypothetical protein Plec18170_004400 [Paecilomyces lecythidis]
MALITLSPFTLGAGFIFLAVIGLSIFRQASWSKTIPGPWLAKFTKLWYLWQIYRCDFHWTNINLHRERGKIVQLAPGWFSIDDPDALKIIYGHGSQWAKGEWYDSWNFGSHPDQTNLFSERNNARHSVMRRKVASMYSMSALVSYEPYVDNCIGLLQRQLAKFASERSIIDVGHWMQCYAFDVIGEITFGERFGFLDEGKDINKLIQNLDVGMSACSYFGVFTGLLPLQAIIFKLTNNEDSNYVQRFTERRVAITRSQKLDLQEDGPVYMAKKFIHAQEKGDGSKTFTDWDVKLNAGANIGAGSDTTSLSLSSVLFYIYRHPRCLERVRKELENSGLTSHSQLSFQQVQKLPYLQAAIKEALRMHPGTGLPMWRVVPEGGAIICGQYFPAGTNIGVNSWVAHRNQTVYGADADEYRPERWLEAPADEGITGDKSKAIEQSFMPFGIGARTCIGKNISLLEMNKLIPILIRDYDIEFVTKDGEPERSKYMPARNRWFVKPDNLYARITRRQSSAN